MFLNVSLINFYSVRYSGTGAVSFSLSDNYTQYLVYLIISKPNAKKCFLTCLSQVLHGAITFRTTYLAIGMQLMLAEIQKLID